MPSITINYQDFNKGVSVSDFLPTGGFSPKDKGHNLHATPGVLNSQPAVVDNGSCKDIIAWTNKQGGTDADIVALGIDTSNDDGFIYSFSSTGVPTQKGTDNGRNYKKGISDIVFFKGDYYTTSDTDIAKINGALSSIDYTWWTTTKGKTALTSGVAHHLLVFEDTLYITNGNKLISFDGTNIVEAALTIDQYYNITAFEEYQGKVYIAAQPLTGNTNGYHGLSKLYVWDGVDVNNWLASFEVEDYISALYVYNGTLLVFNNYYCGYFNGINIIKLFDISNMVFKGNITQFKERLYISTYRDIICYDGKKYYYFFYNSADDAVEGIHCSKGDNFIISTNGKAYLTYLNNAGGAALWSSNRYHFSGNVRIRKVVVELATALYSGSDMAVTLSDHQAAVKSLGSIKYSDGDRGMIKEFNANNLSTYSVQVRINFIANSTGISQITIFYDGTEQPARKS